jgi:hypothetical protein
MKRATLMLAVLTVLTLAMLSPPAKADIIYTWHEDDGQDVTGALTVLSATQAAGSITLSDVVSLTFDTPAVPSLGYPPAHFTTSDLDPTDFPLSISTLDASPALASQSFGTPTPLRADVFSVQFDTNWSVSGGEQLFFANGAGFTTGDGHWTISGASSPTAVPEPSTLTLLGLGSLGLLGYGWSRRKQVA